MEIGLHRRITKSRDGLRQEQSDALQMKSQANFDGQDDPAGWFFQDCDGVAEHKWLVDTEEESTCIRYRASFFSSSVRNFV